MWLQSDRNPQVLVNLQRMFGTGRLANTGYLSILPVDQGIEHSAGASFAKNPIYFDGENIVKLAIEGGCNAVATTFGVLGSVSRKYAHRIPFLVKINHNELLTMPNKFDQIMFGTVREAWNLGAAAVGATIYFGSDNADRQIIEVARAFEEALRAEKLITGGQIIHYAGGGGMIAVSQFLTGKVGNGNAVVTQGAGHLSFPLSNKTPVSLNDVIPLARIAGEYELLVVRTNSEFKTVEDLNISPEVLELCHLTKGMVLVTGPTGSGKSTTLCALIDYINRVREDHIITIEDPIEFYHYSKKSTVNQREIGTDVPSFSEALRRALRQDPDVILVGELRDLETIEAAISAAETGHVVFGTLHTTGAQGTVNRIIDAFPTNQQEQVRTQLSTAILGVLSQTLLPKIGGGRVAAYEVLVCTPGIGNLIRENKTFRINSSIQTGAKLGMQLLDDHLFKLWNEKKVAEDDVLAKAQNVDDLARRIANAKQGIFDDAETVARKAAKEMER